MNLQNTFYLVATVSNILLVVFLLGIAVLLFYIWQKVTKIYEMIDQRINGIKEAITHPREFASDLGAAVSHTIFHPTRKRR